MLVYRKADIIMISPLNDIAETLLSRRLSTTTQNTGELYELKRMTIFLHLVLQNDMTISTAVIN